MQHERSVIDLDRNMDVGNVGMRHFDSPSLSECHDFGICAVILDLDSHIRPDIESVVAHLLDGEFAYRGSMLENNEPRKRIRRNQGEVRLVMPRTWTVFVACMAVSQCIGQGKVLLSRTQLVKLLLRYSFHCKLLYVFESNMSSKECRDYISLTTPMRCAGTAVSRSVFEYLVWFNVARLSFDMRMATTWLMHGCEHLQ